MIALKFSLTAKPASSRPDCRELREKSAGLSRHTKGEYVMKKLLAMAICLSLTGCAGSPIGNALGNQRYQTTWDIMNTWVGSSEDDLVTSWGLPDSSYTLSDGSKILSYEHVWKKSSIHAQEFGYRSAGDYRNCVQKFLIENGTVTKWDASGTCKKVPDGSKLISKDIPIPRPTLR
ncbi:hypothetical protein [Pararhizobium polonicum]|uniref:hypothetical protein n=1 Tax=Pararhizobium polonicum TaxID=1612624 RepID=UPI001931160F|nr:hypothetical protein [Pararhizobium polonicum]